MRPFFVVAALGLACALLLVTNAAQMPAAPPDHAMFTPADVQWGDGPKSLPAGAQGAVLEGNPSQAGPFTLRLRLPAGYRVPPHWHPQIEHVTVISGSVHFGMGETFDSANGRHFPAGSFLFMPPGMRHFAWTTEEAVIQLHGIGPWEINYVNPADDPRTPR